MKISSAEPALAIPARYHPFMHSIPTFRRYGTREMGCRPAVVLTLFCTLVVIAPAGYALWYFQGGGSERQAQASIQRLVQRDPVADARADVAAGKVVYLVIRRGFDLEAPGIGLVLDDRNSPVTFEPLPYITGQSLTAEQQQLNAAAREYGRAYNTTVLESLRQR